MDNLSGAVTIDSQGGIVKQRISIEGETMRIFTCILCGGQEAQESKGFPGVCVDCLYLGNMEG